jgi:hypothetical protein
MKTTIAIIFAASTLLVAGCATTARHPTRWEYQVVTAPELPTTAFQPGGTNSNTLEAAAEHRREIAKLIRENQQAFLNELGKEGWILVNEDQGTFYLKRPSR